jgi:hypothetical protein
MTWVRGGGAFVVPNRILRDIGTDLQILPSALIILKDCSHRAVKTLRVGYKNQPPLRVFKNRVLRKIFEPKGEEVTGEWWRLLNDDLHDLYCSPNRRIIRVIKPRRMRRAGQVAYRAERYSGLLGNLREWHHFEDLGADRRIILKLIFKKWDGGA